MAHIQVAVLALDFQKAVDQLTKYCKIVHWSTNSAGCSTDQSDDKEFIWNECIYQYCAPIRSEISVDAFITSDGELVSIDMMLWFALAKQEDYAKYLADEIIKSFRCRQYLDEATWFIFSCHI